MIFLKRKEKNTFLVFLGVLSLFNMYYSESFLRGLTGEISLKSTYSFLKKLYL